MTTTISIRLPYLQGKFPMKSGEKRKDLYTAMPSCPFSFLSYMIVIR